VIKSAIKIAVSVDIKDWYHIPAVYKAPFSPDESGPNFLNFWVGEYDFLTKPTHRTLNMLDELDIQVNYLSLLMLSIIIQDCYRINYA